MDNEYADNKQFSASILNIWKVITKVHLPWIKIFFTHFIDPDFEVNGAAAVTSPDFIELSSSMENIENGCFFSSAVSSGCC